MQKILNVELSEQETQYLGMGIAIGSGIGIVVGAIINNVGLFFAVGSVMGVIGSIGYSYYLRYKSIKKYVK